MLKYTVLIVEWLALLLGVFILYKGWYTWTP